MLSRSTFLKIVVLTSAALFLQFAIRYLFIHDSAYEFLMKSLSVNQMIIESVGPVRDVSIVSRTAVAASENNVGYTVYKIAIQGASAFATFSVIVHMSDETPRIVSVERL